MSLGEMVSEMEQDLEHYKGECISLEQSLEEVEVELEATVNDLNQANEFIEWVKLAYPDIAEEFKCVDLVKEKANGIQK